MRRVTTDLGVDPVGLVLGIGMGDGQVDLLTIRHRFTETRLSSFLRLGICLGVVASTIPMRVHGGQTEETCRGFRIYGRVQDANGNEVRVQQSSSMESSCCWVFAQDQGGNSWHAHPPSTGGVAVVSPHLSKDQAMELAMALVRFASEEGA